MWPDLLRPGATPPHAKRCLWIIKRLASNFRRYVFWVANPYVRAFYDQRCCHEQTQGQRPLYDRLGIAAGPYVERASRA